MCIIRNIQADVILLQETWLLSHKPFSVRNFRTFRLDRGRSGGGLLILVSSRLCHNAVVSFELMCPECEILAVDIALPGGSEFSLANVYFPQGVCIVGAPT